MPTYLRTGPEISPSHMQREKSRRWLTINVTSFLLLFEKWWHCIHLHTWRTAAFVLIDTVTWVFIKHKLTLVRGWDVKKKMMNNGVSSKQVIEQYFSNKKHQNLTFYFKDLGNDATLWAYPQKQPSELLSFPQNWQHQSQLQPLTSSRWFLCFLYLGGRIWRIRQDKAELVFLHVRAKSNFY